MAGAHQATRLLSMVTAMSTNLVMRLFLIAEKTGCPVYVDPDRSAAMHALLLHEDVDVVLSDDGLQHYKTVSRPGDRGRRWSALIRQWLLHACRPTQGIDDSS